MNFSCARMRQTSSFSFEAGQITSSCCARTPLRMRVRRSPIGSVMAPMVDLLPARLRHARDEAAVGHLAQADTAESELPEITARPAADVAALIGAHLEFWGPLRLDNERLL